MEHYFEEDRLVLILKQIQNRNFITLTEIAERLNVSTRTVRNDIKSLNDIFGDSAFIDGEQGSYRLYIIDIEDFEKKREEIFKSNGYLDSPKKRMAYIFKTLLKSNIPYVIDELAYEMNVGRSTVNGDIKKLNEILSPYGISIEGKSNSGITLVGGELNKRLFILENIYNFIYKDNTLEQSVEDSIFHISEKYKFETMTAVAFKKTVIIMIDRVLSGNFIEKLPNEYYDIEKNNISKPAREVAEALEKILNIFVPTEEKIFISIPIIGMRTPTNIETVYSLGISEDIHKTIDKIIEQIKYELNLYINKNNLNEEFFYHISFMINRLKFGYLLKNPISEEIREKYPLAYKMSSIAGRIISKEYNVEVPEDELGYITAYFGAYMLEYKTSQAYYKIALVCGTGRGTARLISTQLKRVLDKDAQLDLYADNQVTEEILNSYDIVFTTLNLAYTIKTPIIKIQDIFDEKEILLEIEKTKQLQKLSIPLTRIGGISIIAALIDEYKFFILDNNKSYIENTCDMIDNLQKEGFVDIDFKDRVLKREEKSTMVFNKSIAFPHAVNYLDDNIVIAIGISEEGIKSDDGSNIKLIFLLALPKSENQDDTVLVRIYDEIISIAQDENIVKELSKTKDFKSIIKSFIKLGIGSNI